MSTVSSWLSWRLAGERWERLLIALAAISYLLLAAVAAGAVVAVAMPGLQARLLPLAGMFAVAAYATERASHRATDVFAKNAALALYVVAAMLLPAPWAVLIAAVAVIACHLTKTGTKSAARITATAHTTFVVALVTLLVHVAAGDARLWDGLLRPLGSAHMSMIAHVIAAPGATIHLSAAGALIGLASAFYLLDTVPLTIIGAVVYHSSPLRFWQDRYGRTLAFEVAIPSLGILAAVIYATAPAAAPLLLPLFIGLDRALAQAANRRSGGSGERAARTDAKEARARVASVENLHAEARDRLSAVLAAVQAIGRKDDLASVARTLAQAAVQLTVFRSCTIYLYESHDGVFVPYVGSDIENTPATDAPISRDDAERLMSLQNRLGYSYYTRAEREDDAPDERWRFGDVLLVPLLMKNGDVTGLISLDRPAHGLAPRADDLAPLETVAALGAGVIARLRLTDEALHLATTDALTGLLNRRAFEDRLDEELAANAYRRPVALMMIDLDDFGSINNTYGHQIGDEALRLVSGVIRAHLRQSDAGGRYGGDEFVVILPGLDGTGALDIAERLRAALEQATTRAAADGALPQVYTSIGVAAFPHDAAAPDTLIKAADDALYRSKRLGKNRVSLRGVA